MTSINRQDLLKDNDIEIYKSMKEFYKNKKVLVVGPEGFLGFNSIFRLHEMGAEISIVTRHKKSRIPTDLYKHQFFCDLRDTKKIKKAVENQELVFDFAGVSGSVSSNLSPYQHLDEECGPHLSLFKVCTEMKNSPLIIFCSTRLVYGSPQYLPVDENHPLNPTNIYAVHKITLENYLKVFSRIYNLRSIIVRLSNPYGPYQPLKTKNYGIMNLFLNYAVNNIPITIFGDGHQKRDYIYIDDVINIFFLLAMNPQCYGEIFNYGGDNSISLKESMYLIQQIIGKINIEYINWPKEYEIIETGDYQSDISKISRYIKRPTQTPLLTGFQKTIDYYKSLNKKINKKGE